MIYNLHGTTYLHGMDMVLNSFRQKPKKHFFNYESKKKINISLIVFILKIMPRAYINQNDPVNYRKTKCPLSRISFPGPLKISANIDSFRQNNVQCQYNISRALAGETFLCLSKPYYLQCLGH